MLKKIQFLIMGGAMFAASNASAALVDDLLVAADNGQCIETAAASMITAQGADKAGDIVTAALQAILQREAQQKALGCKGDVAAQAIAAGADPDDVLGATAAGLGAPGAGAPANLGGIGGGNAGGGAGTASAS